MALSRTGSTTHLSRQDTPQATTLTLCRHFRSRVCMQGFPAVTAIETNLQNRLDIGNKLQVSLSPITPRWDRLCRETSSGLPLIQCYELYFSCTLYLFLWCILKPRYHSDQRVAQMMLLMLCYEDADNCMLRLHTSIQ